MTVTDIRASKTTNRRQRRAEGSTATHRPAKRQRLFRHDELIAVDLFSGFGGLTEGIRRAGFTTIMAANHNAYKVEVHEANHPEAEHWIADLINPDSSDYHSARDLPAADILVAGISCTNHSQANTKKAYEQSRTLFDLDTDPDFEERVTKSERDRATALCVLQYAQRHHPRLMLIECTTELTSWGPALPHRPKVGDGTTYRWWLKEVTNLSYRHRVLYLNSQFFGVPQSRDRLYIVFWDPALPEPDLDHRPLTWCGRCDEVLPAVWSWKTGIPDTGSVRYGKQYRYTCLRCRGEVVPAMSPSLNALDLTDLGVRIGDKPVKKHKDGSTGPLALATLARAERCRQRFAEFPAVLMPAKAAHGTEKHPWQPMATQTSQQETALLSAGALTGNVMAAHRHNGDGQHITRPMDTVTTTHEKAVLFAGVNNFQGAPRGVDDALPTQGGSETLSLVSAGILPFRKNTMPTVHGEPMPTVTSDQVPGLITAAGLIKNNGSIGEAKYRAHPVSSPLGAVVASTANQGLLFSGWSEPSKPEPKAAFLDAEWRAALADLALEDCYFRMLSKYEVGRGCGFDVDFAGRKGSFIVWGSARDQINGYGNAVSPAVGEWIGSRLRAVLHAEVAA
jgi:DNA (cytosine-5)-methyltransferase 1